MTSRVVVFGGTGETGRRVVERLLESGHMLRIVCRNPDRAQALFGARVEVHCGDVRDANSLVGAATDAQVAISAIGTRTYFGKNGGAAVDELGTRNLVAEVTRAESIGQLIFLSAFGVDRRSPFLSLFSLALNRYFHWKALAEAAVRESGVPYTIVRPVELRNRPHRAAAWINQSAPLSLLRTVSRDRVAEVLVACLNNADALGKTFEVCEARGKGAPGDCPDIATQLATMLIDANRPLPTRTPLF